MLNDELTRIENSKADLKSAIEEKGVSVAPNDKLNTYAEKVRGIQTGGAVSSVNGKIGDVVITANDLGNLPIVSVSGTTLKFDNVIDVTNEINAVNEVIG